MAKLPVIGKPGAPRTVAVILLGIALLELGISTKFGQLWQLAFAGTPRDANGQQQSATGQQDLGSLPFGLGPIHHVIGL